MCFITYFVLPTDLQRNRNRAENRCQEILFISLILVFSFLFKPGIESEMQSFFSHAHLISALSCVSSDAGRKDKVVIRRVKNGGEPEFASGFVLVNEALIG